MKIYKLFILLLIIGLTSCGFKEVVVSTNISNKDNQIKKILRPFRTQKPFLILEKIRMLEISIMHSILEI